jgi:hypothetical protein
MTIKPVLNVPIMNDDHAVSTNAVKHCSLTARRSRMRSLVE